MTDIIRCETCKGYGLISPYFNEISHTINGAYFKGFKLQEVSAGLYRCPNCGGSGVKYNGKDKGK